MAARGIAEMSAFTKRQQRLPFHAHGAVSTHNAFSVRLGRIGGPRSPASVSENQGKMLKVIRSRNMAREIFCFETIQVIGFKKQNQESQAPQGDPNGKHACFFQMQSTPKSASTTFTHQNRKLNKEVSCMACEAVKCPDVACGQNILRESTSQRFSD